MFSLAGGQVEDRLVITGTAAGHAATTPPPQPPTPSALHTALQPLQVIVHMEEVMDGDAITENALAQQRGVSAGGPPGELADPSPRCHVRYTTTSSFKGGDAI